jgi:NodT family efflux transporter outer membrane factor (OMF) lipoprotein
MKKLLGILLLGSMLAGCVSTPSTTPSEVALKPAALGLAGAPAPAIAERWWTAFGDPQLDALVDTALSGSPTLAAALARLRAAQSQLAASTAATYPQVSLDGNETRERFSKNYIIPPPYGGTTQWIGTVQANVSWSLDFFGKEQAQIDRAKANTHAAALDAAAARLLLAGSVTQAYIALARAEVLIDVAQEAVNQRSAVLSLTGGRVKAGLDTVASQKQAEALLAMAREDLILARANREIAIHQIAALTGHGADAYDIARPHLSETALALPATLPADLLARRADIAAAQARIDTTFQGREIARLAYYPDINLLGLAGWAAIGLGPMFSASALQYGAGAAIHLPIFDAGKLDADYAGATAGLDEAVANYNETLVSAVRQAADAVTQLRAVEDQGVQQRAALAAAEASFDLATRRYRSGLNPQLNVLDAETVLIQARRQSAALASDDAAARVTLLMAMGGGFVPEPANADIPASNNQDTPHE